MNSVPPTDPADVLAGLIESGVLDAGEAWRVTPASGGLNSSVFRIHSRNDPSGYTVRIRVSGSFVNEIEALGDAAGCPGVPEIIHAREQVLVHRYLDGRPAPLGNVGQSGLDRLAGALTCIHRRTYSDYTPWPDRERRPGTLGDLFRFRAGSLQNYASYPAARSGALDPRLPDLLDRLSPSITLSGSGWDDERFSRLHGDLSFGNLLWSGQDVALIDWEFSRVGDPAEDLGYLLTEQPLDEPMSGALRDSYLAAGGGERAWSRVPAYALFTAVDSVLWWADYPETPSLDRRSEIDRRVVTALRWAPAAGGS